MSLLEVAAGWLSRSVAWVRSAALAGSRGGRRPAPLVEVAGLLLVILLFARLHAAAGKDAAAATANALALQSLERALHLDIALRANQWLTEHPALIQPAVYYYRLYYLAITGVLVWIFVRHAEVYIKVRRTLVAMAVLVLPVFWALPMSPPRFALPGVVDIIATYDILGGHATREIANGQNVYSAMPSMHVGWSLWCAYAAWSALRASHPRLALLSWNFPLGMAAVVLITGNHYVLDIAGSAVLLTVSIAVVAAWGRLTGRRRARE
ncbi:phosphatase PAP2 family protein [Nonomuraea deserti]|uniref:phosphatase PAP2 family protein n=1 Tax=Nonomuraea deserti TaxID=1848322 RepID=UPI001C706BB0|nr:phosphatase PAP2 family protein [Nonomuraea deserti]